MTWRTEQQAEAAQGSRQTLNPRGVKAARHRDVRDDEAAMLPLRKSNNWEPRRGQLLLPWGYSRSATPSDADWGRGVRNAQAREYEEYVFQGDFPHITFAWRSGCDESGVRERKAMQFGDHEGL